MNYWSCEFDMAHPFSPHLRASYLDATTLADNTLKTNPLVLAAVTLPIPSRAEDLLTKESVLLGTKRSIVNRLGLLDLSMRPGTDISCSS
jgi:hypothetical protein